MVEFYFQIKDGRLSKLPCLSVVIVKICEI